MHPALRGSQRPSYRPWLIVLMGLLAWATTTRAQECEELRARWRTGNYGLRASTGWPRRPDGDTLAVFEIDPVLAGLRRQVMSLYSQYHSGEFVVMARGDALLSDLIEQVKVLETLYQTQPSPRLAEQIRAVRQGIQQAGVELDAQATPFRRRYEELQALCRKARTSMRQLLEEKCGAVPAESFEIVNWEALPPPPALEVPPSLAGLDLPSPVSSAPVAAQGEPVESSASTSPATDLGLAPDSAAEARNTADASATEDEQKLLAENPLWVEVEQSGKRPTEQSVRGATPVPKPAQADSASTPEVVEHRPTPEASSAKPGSQRERDAFLDLLATPDESEPSDPLAPRSAAQASPGTAATPTAPAAAPNASAETWSLFPLEPSEAGAATATSEPVEEEEEQLLLDPNAAPRIGEETLAVAGPAETKLVPISSTPRPPQEEEPAKELLFERFSKGLGPERVGGTWVIDNQALQGTGTLSGDSLYVLSRDPWLNYQLGLDFRIDGGDMEAGLVLRAQSEMRDGQIVRTEGGKEDGYLLRIRANGQRDLGFQDSIDLALRQNGTVQRVLCGGNADLLPHHWYRLTARLDFSRIDLRLDGKPFLSCRDDTFASGGTMLRLAGTTEARFDNISADEILVAGSTLPSPEQGVLIDPPGSGAEGWGRLGGEFTNNDGVLLGEAGQAGPALARKDVQRLLQESKINPGGAMQIQVDLRAVGQGGGGGLFLGVEGSRFYAVVLRPAKDFEHVALEMLRMERDNWEPIVRQEVPADLSQWHRITLVRRPGTLELRLDEKRIIQGRASLPPVETLGIYVDAGARLLTDRLVVATPR